MEYGQTSHVLTILFGLWSVSAGQMMTRSNIVLERNQFKNILIAIGNDVPENTNIIERLKAVFIDTSRDVFQATRNRAYFKDITIFIPQSWSTRPEYQRATSESFDQANVIVDKPNAEYGDNPYVVQLGGCGAHGEYMHLTPDFLINEATSVRTWGPYGKTLTHEWAHLRWGLFDEYPIDSEGDKHFYHSASGNVEAVRCTLDVAGDKKHRLTGRDCIMNATTSLPEDDCRLFPNYAATEAEASYMFYHFMPSITTFCDANLDEGTTLHNFESPNKHNRLCAGKSAWEVMREHVDFQNGSNPPLTEQVDTEPTFKLVQRQDTMRVVVVMDTSGSMLVNNNIMKLKQAVRRYILTTLPTGSKVGLVRFAAGATVLAEMTELIDDNTREALAARLPTSAAGATAMGLGMRKGIEVLERGGQDPAGSIMLLIGDGKENKAPYIREVLPQVLAKRIVVDTILYTAKADIQLISLAAKTGGMSFFYSGQTDSSALRDALTTTSNQRQDDKTKIHVQVASESIKVSKKKSRVGKVYVDSVLGEETRFLFSWDTSYSSDVVDVTLTGPRGDIFNKSYQHYKKSQGEIIVTMESKYIQDGQWLYNISNRGSRTLGALVSVESKTKPNVGDAKPVSVVATVSSVELNFTNDVSTTVSIYAKVTKGYLPLVNAQVVARVEKPAVNGDMDVYEMQLRDNGVGADNTKDDGIYSGFFTNFVNTDGDYSVSVKVKNEDGQAKIKTVVGQRALPLQFYEGKLEQKEEDRKFSYEDAELFERATPGGYFKTTGIADRVNSGKTDFFAPSRVNDLRVVEASFDKRIITLQFTAVGDDFVDGNASSYEIKVAKNFTDLYKDFENATAIQQENIIAGNLTSPQKPFSTETFTIRISDVEYTSNFVYAVRAVDEEGNKGQTSNIVSAKLIKVDPSVDVVLIVLCVVGVVIVISVVVGVILYRKKCRPDNNKGQTDHKATNRDPESGVQNSSYMSSKSDVRI